MASVEEELEETTDSDGSSSLADPPELLRSYHFGCGPFRPRRLQFLGSKRAFTIFLSFFAVLEGAIVIGLTSVNLSSIEKRYHFTSTAAGVIPTCFDITVTSSVIFISYFGGRAHKPRWLGISMIVMGIGSLIFASPQLFLGSYKPGGRVGGYQNELCHDARSYELSCFDSDIVAYLLFVCGKALMGFGAAPLYTVAQAYLDEIVHPRYISIHMGIYHSVGILGPVLGYGLGGSLLSVYVDPWEDTTLSPSDPSWVGAWWVSFALVGVLSIVGAAPFLMFPRYLPDSYAIWKERSKEMAKVYGDAPNARRRRRRGEGVINIEVLKDFGLQMKRLILNPSFIFCSLALGGLYLISSGVVVFGPQFLENEFYQSPTTAGLLAGAVGVTTAIFGVLTGAFIIYLFKLKGRKMMLLCFVISLVGAPLVLGLFLHCPSINVVGINTPGINGSYGIDTASCARECDCMSHTYEPVCGEDGLTYFSPCRAGCYNTTVTSNNKSFYNCQCVKEELAEMNSNDTDSVEARISRQFSASNGRCPIHCNLLVLFILGIMVVLCAVFILQIPIYYFTLRVVADDQRSLALGVQSAIWRLSGAIPGPIIFGAIFDSACLKWEGTCGHRGNCWVYDNNHLSIGTISFSIPVMLVVAVLFLLSFSTFPKKRKDIGEEKEEEEEEEEQRRSGDESNDHFVHLTGVFKMSESESEGDDDKRQLIRQRES